MIEVYIVEEILKYLYRFYKIKSDIKLNLLQMFLLNFNFENIFKNIKKYLNHAYINPSPTNGPNIKKSLLITYNKSCHRCTVNNICMYKTETIHKNSSINLMT